MNTHSNLKQKIFRYPILPVFKACRLLTKRVRGLDMIRKLKDGRYRLYSRKISHATGKRRNLGTFDTLEAAKKHEREIQYFKRHYHGNNFTPY